MQYDDLMTKTFTFPGVVFTAGGTKKLQLPFGAKLARVLDISVRASVTFTQTTTPALVEVGDGTNASAFAQLNCGAVAAGSTIGGADVGGVEVQPPYNAQNYNSGAGLHDLILTFVAPTGGAPAGTGDVEVSLGFDRVGK